MQLDHQLTILFINWIGLYNIVKIMQEGHDQPESEIAPE